ncbi:Rossmann-like and DUF2520 domain-containing protein [Acinetobacter sp. ANC 4648]|uniref:Rossmann-like and DUF2520 domain-containing protein n=1 Tax=Acinetobacter sp. ANC 4648 TaxID=1977875 RepID=UPI000A356B8D|nr:Rossmann-like and DUF2520 domain-containing protein [Acinetobacter sp. ANC 4648]OTG83113.1 F420-dependent NADP oxidoreductase [Acinetobacter sp. ANC 4648]
MRISFIGSGRVATHLATVLLAQHEIVQIYSQQLVHAKLLAKKVQAQAIDQYQQIDQQIDLMIIAVSDQAIAVVIEQLSAYLKNTLIVHTSGSTNLDVLMQYHQKSGVFYPLQTFSLKREINWTNTPLFIEAAGADDLTILTELANSLSSRVYQYSSEQRLSLHLAAVFACNFSNYCYDMAKQIVDAKKVDFSLLYPLIIETATKATQSDPSLMQTGPAVRKDVNILNMHQRMLSGSGRDDLKQVYELLSQGIIQRHISE